MKKIFVLISLLTVWSFFAEASSQGDVIESKMAENIGCLTKIINLPSSCIKSLENQIRSNPKSSIFAAIILTLFLERVAASIYNNYCENESENESENDDQDDDYDFDIE